MKWRLRAKWYLIPICLLLFGAVTVTPAYSEYKALTASPAPCHYWGLPPDPLAPPDIMKENPARDICGNGGIWYFMRSEGLSRNPQTYSLLPEFVPNAYNIEGLQQWQGTLPDAMNAKLPAIGLNRTSAQHPLSVWWDPGVLRAHPAQTQMAVMGWRSPFDGAISISGSVSDMDVVGLGDGVLWYLDKGTINLASGQIHHTETQQFRDGAGGSHLLDVRVRVGDFIYLVIHPNETNNCDSTKVRLSILPYAEVPIDIKPGQPTNMLNAKSKGVIRVAILGTSTFDAVTVDPLSVRFGGEGASVVRDQSRVQDVNGDGRADMVLVFALQETGFTDDEGSGCLTGQTTDGISFRGCDQFNTSRHDA